MIVKSHPSGCSGQRGLLSLFVRRTVLLGKGVGAAFTAIAPKHVGTTLVLWLEFEAGQRGLFSLAVRRTALLGKGVGATFTSIVSSSRLRFRVMYASSSFGRRTLCLRYPSELPLCVRAFGPFHFHRSNGCWAQSFGAVFAF